MEAIAHQDKQILTQGWLESEGFSFVSSLRGSYHMATPYGAHEQSVRDRENMPLLQERFAAAGPNVVFPPGTLGDTVVGVLVDNGSTINVTGALWAKRLALLPGVSIPAHTVGGACGRRCVGGPRARHARARLPRNRVAFPR